MVNWQQDFSKEFKLVKGRYAKPLTSLNHFAGIITMPIKCKNNCEAVKDSSLEWFGKWGDYTQFDLHSQTIIIKIM
jgi:hypothetical protein